MEVPHSTVYKAVRALRPRWLQARSGATLRSRQPQTAMVYIDDPRAAAAAPHVLNRTTNLPGATVAFLIGLMLLTGPVERLSAQQGQGVNGDRVSVFLYCASRFCNLTYFRTELFWVNWVRIPQSSDVHLIMTSRGTGAGGREYQLDFIGNGDFDYEEQLAHQALPTDTDRKPSTKLRTPSGSGCWFFFR